MSFSAGVYSLPGPALNTGDTVSATENNTFRNDVATAFNLTMLRNGTSTATANLPMGGYKLTGLGNGTASGDSLAYGQTADAVIYGVTLGRGAGAVSTNTAVGASALAANTTGSGVTAFGYNALNLNTSGTGTAFGYVALAKATTADGNSAFGSLALYNTTTGSYNVAVGLQALQSNTTASNNTAVGYQAGYPITTGTNNISIGQGSGGTLTTGSYNTYIGINASASGVAVSGELVVSADSSAVGKGSNTGFIKTGGSGVYQANNSTLWSITSDQRLKKNIIDNTTGLSAITAIKVRNFEYRLPEEITELSVCNAVNIQGIQLGPIAQELAQILPDCVKTESTGVMSVDSSNVIWYMVNAIKELKAEIDALKGQA